MATEIIDAVRKAEIDAELAEREATQKREDILKNAREAAVKTVTAKTEEAKKKAENLLADAARESEQIIKDASEKSKTEADRLKKSAGQKEQEAIECIISEIV